MSSLNTCAIVIPVYKEIPNCSEQKSLIQAFKVLQKFKFYLVCPNNLNVAYYLNTSNLYQVDMTITTFDPNYFANLTGYNKLLLSLDFYKKFTSVKFILIYQLDAWVFRNELNYWCKQNYDYIGAPWFNEDQNGKLVFVGVGNGGFSLRKIASHIKVLHSFSLIQRPSYLLYLFMQEKSFSSLLDFLKSCTFWNNTFYLFNDYAKNEDIFWGIVAKQKFNWFKLPSKETASQFSLELFPSQLKAENEPPFGCHAWERYERNFWLKFIKF